MLALEESMDVHRLRQQGMSVRAIAHPTGYNRRTVTKYRRNGLKEPRYRPRAPRPGKLDPYRDYIANCQYLIKNIPKLPLKIVPLSVRASGPVVSTITVSVA